MATGHHHHSLEDAPPAPAPARRLLLVVLLPLLVATAIGLVALWPDDRMAGSSAIDLGFDSEQVDGVVRGARIDTCASTPEDSGIECRFYDVRL